ALISGQKPALTRARKSVATFKVRQGWPIGCRVTLRGARMYEFLDRLINVAIPRIRDFRGLPPRSFDGRGNYSLGIKEQIIFPEIDFDKVDAVRGLDVTIVTTAETDDEARALLEGFQFPIRSCGMAKKSMIERDKRRRELAAKYAARRAELRKAAKDTRLPIEEREAAALRLQKLPRDSSPTRVRNRCRMTGRPR